MSQKCSNPIQAYFRIGLVLGCLLGFFMGMGFTLSYLAQPPDEVKRARKEREKAAIQVMIGALRAYETTLTNKP